MNCDNCHKYCKEKELTLLKDGFENNFKVMGYFCKDCLENLTNMNNKQQCTCENFKQNEDCEHIGNKVLEECGFMNNKQSWEEEFICIYCKISSDEDEENCECDCHKRIKLVKSLLAEREAEIRKETILAVLPEEECCGGDYWDGFNKCRQSIIEKAKSLYNINLE